MSERDPLPDAFRPGPRRRWHPGVPMTLFFLCMLPTVLALGNWQLARARYKETLEQEFFDRLAAAPTAAPLNARGEAFRRILLTGRYHAEEYFLIDSQTHEGRVGYLVMNRFDTTDERTFLVNRGWIEAPSDRSVLPFVDAPRDIVTVAGIVWPELGELPLQTRVDVTAGWPKRVPDGAFDRLRDLMPEAAEYEVRLEMSQAGVLEPAPQAHDFKAVMHRGYATQWFGLSLVLCIGYLVYGFRRHD